MKPIALALCLILPLSACAGAWPKANSWLSPRAAPIGAPPAQTKLQSLTTGGQSAAAFDRVSAAQKAAAVAAPSAALSAAIVLGIVTVSLGSPNEPGLWLKSNLVNARQNGRAVLANGSGVNVTLMPSASGASLSFSAYRALGLGLTDLPQVQVLALP
jgi:hypothetical protein